MAEEHDRLMAVSPYCPKCKVGKLQIPEDMHPSYCICDTCAAIHLTYMPQDYQENFHRTPYIFNDDGTIKIQTIGLFGGRKSVAAVKGAKFGETLRAFA